MPEVFETIPASPIGVVLQNIAFRFPGKAAPLFDGLDFALPAGTWTCLLGTSGCGKSTLIRLLAGLLAPHQGSVTPSDGVPLAGRVALMAQQDLLLPWLSVLGNVLLGARLRGEAIGPRERSRAGELLAAAGLDGLQDARPATLSGGMRQRVALVRTLMEDRPVVLMDEPFSALDAVTRLRLQELAAGLLKGRTVLMVTHDPLEALRLGDSVHVLGGSPARPGPALTPPGPPPRRPGSPALVTLEAALLERLAA